METRVDWALGHAAEIAPAGSIDLGAWPWQMASDLARPGRLELALTGSIGRPWRLAERPGSAWLPRSGRSGLDLAALAPWLAGLGRLASPWWLDLAGLARPGWLNLAANESPNA